MRKGKAVRPTAMTQRPENRHERQREQDQRTIQRQVHEASPVQEIRIFGPAEAVTNPWLLECVAIWLSEAKHRGAPICACCNHEWSLQFGSMPRHFAIVVPYGIPNPKQMLMCGVCEPCMAHPEHQERIEARLRTRWPGLRRLNHPVQAPERVQ